jgi:RNA polymerase-binding transcription factor DksA
VKNRTAFIAAQRTRLLVMRADALAALESGRREAASLSGDDGRDPADCAERDVESAARLHTAGQGFNLVREIDDALARMDRGIYGVCEMTGEEIPEGRLKALPFARFTVVAQSRVEGRARAEAFGLHRPDDDKDETSGSDGDDQ